MLDRKLLLFGVDLENFAFHVFLRESIPADSEHERERRECLYQ
jgi:hypothetical protein